MIAPSARYRTARPAHKGGRFDGREQVLDHSLMQHLLASNSEEHPAPALDGRELIVPKTGACRALKAERGGCAHGRKVSTAIGVLNSEEFGQRSTFVSC